MPLWLPRLASPSSIRFVNPAGGTWLNLPTKQVSRRRYLTNRLVSLTILHICLAIDLLDTQKGTANHLR
jgi:hypothetical protein